MDKQLNFLYDHQADVLSISQGHPIYTDSVPLDQNVILHVEPTTQEIVGFSIVDFLKHFTNSESPVSVPLTVTFEQANKHRRTRIKKKIPARRRAKK